MDVWYRAYGAPSYGPLSHTCRCGLTFSAPGLRPYDLLHLCAFPFQEHEYVAGLSDLYRAASANSENVIPGPHDNR